MFSSVGLKKRLYTLPEEGGGISGAFDLVSSEADMGWGSALGAGAKARASRCR